MPLTQLISTTFSPVLAAYTWQMREYSLFGSLALALSALFFLSVKRTSFISTLGFSISVAAGYSLSRLVVIGLNEETILFGLAGEAYFGTLALSAILCRWPPRQRHTPDE
jgi:hypothetical protein